MTDIKLIKLRNGDNLVTKVKVDESKEYITLIEPVRIHRWMHPSEDGEGAYENATFGPWESFSDNQVFHVRKSEIITLTKPREDVIIYYNKIVHKLKTTPVDRFDRDEPIDNVTKLKETLDRVYEKMGIKEQEEDILEYMYNKDKITKH
jgi:hypothetical protein